MNKQTERMVIFFGENHQIAKEGVETAKKNGRPLNQQLAFLAGKHAHHFSYSELDKVDFVEVAKLIEEQED